MVTTYSHERRINAIKALVVLFILVAIMLAPRIVRAEASGIIQRFQGDSRVETAVEISRNLIPAKQTRDHIVVATSNDFADAQAATPLAVRAHTSILLTPRDFLHAMVGHELGRALKPGGKVFIAGGEKAITPEVANAITDLGLVVERLDGVTRIETAIKLAEKATHLGGGLDGEVSRVFAVSGLDFAPGLLTSSRAARDNGVMVIGDEGINWAKQAYPDAPITVVGAGWSKATDVDVVPIDDVRTLVDDLPGSRSQAIALASVHTFPDALSGGVHAATTNRDLYLISNTPDQDLGTWMKAHYTVDSLAVYGGQVALPDSAIWALAT